MLGQSFAEQAKSWESWKQERPGKEGGARGGETGDGRGGGMWLGLAEGLAKQPPPSFGQGRSVWCGLSLQQEVGAAEGTQRSSTGGSQRSGAFAHEFM